MKKITSTEITTKSSNVTSSINLSLNQNDLINLIIQESLEKLELRINEVKKTISNLTTRNEFNKELNNRFLLPILKKTQEFSEFEKVHKIIGGTKEYPMFSYIMNPSTISEKAGEFFEYTCINGDINSAPPTYENYKTLRCLDIPNFKEIDVFLKINSIKRVNSVGLSNYCSNINTGSLYESIISLKVSSKIREKMRKEYTTYLQKEIDLKNELFDLQSSYLEYKYGEKRIKSKLIKSILSGTEDGKKLLANLDTISGNKLLK